MVLQSVPRNREYFKQEPSPGFSFRVSVLYFPTMNTNSDAPETLFRRIREIFPTLLLRDQARLRRRMRSFASSRDTAALESFRKYLENLSAHTLHRFADSLVCNFPEELPISAKTAEISEALKQHPLVIVCGSTGSGKTTQLPKVALKNGFGRLGRIGCTQPRRIAASALARRVASETGCVCGAEVGYKVRFDDHTARNTVVKFMTDGILLAETRDDPDLLQYDCIILDEIHERSLNIDFLLGYMKLLLARRKDLRVILSSATLDAQRISAFFGGAPVIEVQGRLFPVEDCFLEPEEDEELPDSVARGAAFLTELDPRGDILVFLPGEREIRDCAELLSGRFGAHSEILPLFGRLSAGDQQKVFSPGTRRRIVLATNVAETSLTIPGIRFVIDSGLVRLSRYNPRTRIQELRVEPVSQASARQRRGRCGRLRDGICVHLYSEEALEGYSEFTPPEIQRSSLAGVILQMAALRLPPLDRFPLVDPPAAPLIREGMQALEDLLAIDRSGRLTECGWRLAEIPLDPHLAKMLMSAERFRVLPEMLVIAAFLSIADPRERPFEQAKAADDAHRKFANEDSDFIGILQLHDAVEKTLAERASNQALRRFAQKNFLSYRRLREWRNLIEDLKEICRENKWNSAREVDLERLPADALHKALMSALPRQIGMYDRESKLFSDMKGKKFTLFPGSALAKRKNPPQWVLFFALVETSRVFARGNALIRPEWLEEVAPHICSLSYDRIHWDETSGFVYARERVTAGQLLIHPGRRCHYAKVRPAEARAVFIREGLVSGLAAARGTWLEEFAYLLGELKTLEIKMRRPDSIVNAEAIFHHFDEVLPPEVHSVKALEADWRKNRRNYAPEPEEIMLIPYEELCETDFPDFIECAGQRFPLRYKFDPGEEEDGVFLEIAEEDLNLLDPYLTEYLVPGYLVWKAGFLLRSLPKSLRRNYLPLDDTIGEFMKDCRAGKIFTGRPFSEAFASWLNDHCGETITPDIFDAIELPEYLRMKLAVLDAKGKVRHVYREMPGDLTKDSRVGRNVPAAAQWNLANFHDWPGAEVMPQSVRLSKDAELAAYPALVDEGETLGRALFLRKSEAEYEHARAILKLWRMRLPQILKPLRALMNVPHPMELSFFLKYRDWKEDALDNAVGKALGGDLWEIRSEEVFNLRLEESRDQAAGAITGFMEELNGVFHAYGEVMALLRKLDEESETYEDIEEELHFLFRPGFLKTPEIFERSARYLKALNIRIQRAIAFPQKDRTKGESIAPYIRKFRMGLEMVESFERSDDLRAYCLLLEEARIAAYAPEMRPLVKCGEAVLKERWEALRFSAD